MPQAIADDVKLYSGSSELSSAFFSIVDDIKKTRQSEFLANKTIHPEIDYYFGFFAEVLKSTKVILYDHPSVCAKYPVGFTDSLYIYINAENLIGISKLVVLNGDGFGKTCLSANILTNTKINVVHLLVLNGCLELLKTNKIISANCVLSGVIGINGLLQDTYGLIYPEDFNCGVAEYIKYQDYLKFECVSQKDNVNYLGSLGLKNIVSYLYNNTAQHVLDIQNEILHSIIKYSPKLINHINNHIDGCLLDYHIDGRWNNLKLELDKIINPGLNQEYCINRYNDIIAEIYGLLGKSRHHHLDAVGVYVSKYIATLYTEMIIKSIYKYIIDRFGDLASATKYLSVANPAAESVQIIINDETAELIRIYLKIFTSNNLDIKIAINNLITAIKDNFVLKFSNGSDIALSIELKSAITIISLSDASVSGKIQAEVREALSTDASVDDKDIFTRWINNILHFNNEHCFVEKLSWFNENIISWELLNYKHLLPFRSMAYLYANLHEIKHKKNYSSLMSYMVRENIDFECDKKNETYKFWVDLTDPLRLSIAESKVLETDLALMDIKDKEIKKI